MSVSMSGSSRGGWRRATRFALAILAVILASGGLRAQGIASSETTRGPRFLMANSDLNRVVPLEAESTSILSRVVTLDLKDARFGDLVQEVSAQSGVHLVFGSELISPERRVTIRAQRIPLSNLLSELLHDANVDVVLSGNQATLVRKPATQAPARQKTGVITGRVTEQGTRAPIAGAQILIDSVGRGITNSEGMYRITGVAPGQRKVSVVSIGHRGAMQEVEVGDGATVTVSFALVPAPTQLSEIVVTATGERLRRVEIGNDIVVIKADSIVQREPIRTVADLLEGRVPGLVVQRSSGAPGDPTRIRIRGVSSATLSNDPIIVVDGIRVYSDQSGPRGGNLANGPSASSNVNKYNAPSPLDYMPPSMIETIQVIKGPSAATMYGQDAANGVIVITTKKGRPGKAQWTVSMDRGQSQPASKFPDRYVRFGRAMTDDRLVVCPVNGWLGGNPASGEACLPDGEVQRFQALRDPHLTVLDRGQNTAFSLGVSGGRSGLTYSVNASYSEEQGIVKLSEYEAQRFRSQHGTEPFEWMKRPQNFTRWGVQSNVQAQLGSAMTISLNSGLQRNEQQRSELENRYTVLDDVYVDRSTGVYYKVGGVARGGVTAVLQPTDVRAGFYERATSAATRFTNVLNLNWRPQTWLTINADAGLSVDQNADAIFVPSGFDLSDAQRADGDLRRAQGTAVTRTVNLSANSQVPLGLGFNLRLNGGVNYKGESIADMRLQVAGLPEGVGSIIDSPFQPTYTIYGGENRSDIATYGWYIAPGIAHRRMWLNFGLRLDGGSTFGTNVKLPPFPKLSYSYLISDEPYFPEALRSIFDQLQLRVAYGHAGRQPGPTDRLRLYRSAELTQIGGRGVETVDLQTLGNTQLKPERSQEFEGGFEASILDDRVSVNFTAYRKKTKDQLLHVPVAPSVYGANIRQLRNIGVVLNKGLELALGFEAVRSDLVTWRMEVSFDQNRNEVLELGKGVDPFWTQQETVRDGGVAAGTHGIRVVPGFPLQGRWSTPVLGYADANGNGVLEQNEIVFGDTAVYVGHTLPNYSAGLQSSLSLFRGALSVNAGLTFSDGLTQWNRAYNPAIARGWHDPTKTSLFDQLQYYDRAQFTRIETVYALRLNSLSVGWQVPRAWAGRVGANALSLSVQGTNLGLLSNYSGLDPNVNSSLGGNHVTDGGVLPTPRTFQFRLSATY